MVKAFKHAWNGYEKYAFGHDEIRPVTNQTNDSWNTFGVTLFDALDTMMLMGLDAEVSRARMHVASVSFDRDHSASFFETTIRYLGGLLGAYELSRDALYLDKAKELADRLMPSFKTPSGLPQSSINLRTGAASNHHWTGQSSILAEVGSVQLEFAALSHYLNDSSYLDTARRVFDVLDSAIKPYPGLYPVYISPTSGMFTDPQTITMGALADSFYEYLIKLYVMSDGQDQTSLRMYNEAMDGMIKHLVHKRLFNNQEYAFLGELRNGRPVLEQEHLTCFAPGMLALGASQFSQRDDATLTAAELTLKRNSLSHMNLAKQLLRTCVDTYFKTSTGLGPETISFLAPKDTPAERTLGDLYVVAKPKYILRPETVESLFVLYRMTGDSEYRDMGWQIFQAIEKRCKTPSAYSGLVNVDAQEPDDVAANWDNSMQSFFLAETMKYLYLLFSPNDVIPLDQYVFNTEAHPLGVMGRKA